MCGLINGRSAGPLAKLFEFPATLGTYTACKRVHSHAGSEVVLKITGDHVRLLSVSSASSPQAQVFTAPNGRCMLPSAIVLHSEACFARQTRPRKENSTPQNGPSGGQQIATGPTSSCPALAKHGTHGRQQLSSPPTLRSHVLSQFI